MNKAKIADELIENNKAIAIMMGGRLDVKPPYITIPNYGTFAINDLVYDSSWAKLMPAYVRCQQLSEDVWAADYESGKGVPVRIDFYALLRRLSNAFAHKEGDDEETMMKRLHEAVSNFAKWHNTYKKQQDEKEG